MSLQDLIAKHPLPWTMDFTHIVDANDQTVHLNESMLVTLVQAVNLVGELNSLVDVNAKEYFDMADRCETRYDQRRFEAALACGAAHLSRGMFSSEPNAIAAFAVKYADALLAELSKPGEVGR